MSDSRKAFEAWRKTMAEGHSFFDTWQAARRAALEEADNECEKLIRHYCQYGDSPLHADGAQACADAIRALADQIEQIGKVE